MQNSSGQNGNGTKRPEKGSPKPNLTPNKGTGEYSKPTVDKDGKSYRGDVYHDAKKKTSMEQFIENQNKPFVPAKKPNPDVPTPQHAADTFNHLIGREGVPKKKVTVRETRPSFE